VWRDEYGVKGLRMTFAEWEAGVPDTITQDAIWEVEAYRLALFISDIAFEDCSKLLKDSRTRAIADQLVRATGKISAQIAEGYSRTTGKDRALYFTYALGSSRETRDWYFKGQRILGEEVTVHRLELASSVIRLLLVTLKSERQLNRRIGS
jgi:four helix bundle protein